VLVEVHNNDIGKAIRRLKRKMRREGITREMWERQAYEKPSDRRKRERKESLRRADRRARMKAIEEGLITLPEKKPVEGQQGQHAAITRPANARHWPRHAAHGGSHDHR
jgi:small subunit ribosomal protein S21